MRSGRPRRLLGPTVGAAVVVAVSALIVWAIALWFSWGGECPNAGVQSGGLDKGIAVWPPAAQCVDQRGDPFWHEALPWAPWVIGVLIATAAVILLTGLLVSIRDLRRPVPAATQNPLTLLDASLPPPAPLGDPPSERAEPARSERDPPAMAA